jgi:hypothetical protein
MEILMVDAYARMDLCTPIQVFCEGKLICKF